MSSTRVPLYFHPEIKKQDKLTICAGDAILTPPPVRVQIAKTYNGRILLHAKSHGYCWADNADLKPTTSTYEN